MSKKTISFVLALALGISSVGSVAFADPYSDKAALEQQLQEDANSYKTAQEKVDEIEAAIQAINSQMEDLNSDIEKLNVQIDETQGRLDESNQKVEKTKGDIEEENDLFNKRMRSMYINGINSYVEVLLESKGFSDFLSRLTNVATIIKYDNDVIGNLTDLKASLEAEKAKIEDEKATLDALQQENNEKAALLEDKKEEHSAALAVAEENRDLYQAAQDQTQAQIDETMRLISAMTAGSTTTSRPSRGDSGTSSLPAPSSSGIVATAQQYIGCPYQWGGNGPNVFDCSGLTKYVYAQCGISIPRTAAAQMSAGSYVSDADRQPGDLVFFGSGGNIYHVGIYVGNNSYLHAPQDNETVKISTLQYRSDYAGARRY